MADSYSVGWLCPDCGTENTGNKCVVCGRLRNGSSSGAAWVCPRCNTNNAPGSTVCRLCNAPASSASSGGGTYKGGTVSGSGVSRTSGWVCKKCGAVNSSGAAFCAGCGSSAASDTGSGGTVKPVKPVAPVTPVTPSKPSRGLKAAVIALAVVACLLFIGVITLGVSNTNLEDDLNSTESQLKAANTQLENTIDELDAVYDDLDAANAQLANYQSQLTDTQSQLSNAESQLSDTESALTYAEGQSLTSVVSEFQQKYGLNYKKYTDFYTYSNSVIVKKGQSVNFTLYCSYEDTIWLSPGNGNCFSANWDDNWYSNTNAIKITGKAAGTEVLHLYSDEHDLYILVIVVE